MGLSTVDRIAAVLGCAYFAWRAVGAMRSGVFQGDGDPDVHFDRHPLAFGMTVFIAIIAALLCAVFVVIPNSAYGPPGNSARNGDGVPAR